MQTWPDYNIKIRVGSTPALIFIMRDSVLEIRSSCGGTCGSLGKVLSV